MKVVLLILFILAFIGGFFVIFMAESSIHEIEALVLFVVSAILFSGYTIVSAINLLSSKIEKSLSPK